MKVGERFPSEKDRVGFAGQKHSLSAVRHPPFANPAKSGAPTVVVASGEIKSMGHPALTNLTCLPEGPLELRNPQPPSRHCDICPCAHRSKQQIIATANACAETPAKSRQVLCYLDFDLYPQRAQDFAKHFCGTRASQGIQRVGGRGVSPETRDFPKMKQPREWLIRSSLQIFFSPISTAGNQQLLFSTIKLASS